MLEAAPVVVVVVVVVLVVAEVVVVSCELDKEIVSLGTSLPSVDSNMPIAWKFAS